MKSSKVDYLASQKKAINEVREGQKVKTQISKHTGSNLDEGSGRHMVCEKTGKPILRSVAPPKGGGDSPAACPDSFRDGDHSPIEETKKMQQRPQVCGLRNSSVSDNSPTSPNPNNARHSSNLKALLSPLNGLVTHQTPFQKGSDQSPLTPFE